MKIGTISGKFIYLFLFLLLNNAVASPFIASNNDLTLIIEDGITSPFIAENNTNNKFLLYLGNDYSYLLIRPIPSGGEEGGKEGEAEGKTESEASLQKEALKEEISKISERTIKFIFFLIFALSLLIFSKKAKEKTRKKLKLQEDKNSRTLLGSQELKDILTHKEKYKGGP